MTAKHKGLGRGLDALLGAPARPEGDEELVQLAVGSLRPGKYQPRTRMDEASLAELAASIKSRGVIQPIVVRGVGPSQYEILAGERRWRAARMAGLPTVPAVVRDVPDEAALGIGLIENIQREDLNPLEEAQGLKRLIEEFKLTHEQAAQAVGRSRSAASNLLRLLNLAAPVQQMLIAGDLEMGHARALLALDAAQQILSANEVAAKKLSVRDTEKLVARSLGGNSRQSPLMRIQRDKPRDIVRLEEALADRLTAAVEIRVLRKTKRGEQGEIAISFGSLDELNGLLDKLGASER